MTAQALAAAAAAEPLARTSEGSKSGPIGLAIILLLCIACYFLFKSMSGHLRRVREGFPKSAPTTPGGGARAVPVSRTAGNGPGGAGPAAVEPPPTEPGAAAERATDNAPADVPSEVPPETQKPDAAPDQP